MLNFIIEIIIHIYSNFTVLLEGQLEFHYSIGSMFGEPGTTFYADKPKSNIHLVRLGVAEHTVIHDAYFSLLMSETPSLDVLHGTEGEAAAAAPPPSPSIPPPPAAGLPPAAALPTAAGQPPAATLPTAAALPDFTFMA